MDNNLKHQVFLKIALDLSILSKCCSHKVGSIIVKDGRILSTGINGTPKGFLNCNDIFSEENIKRDREKHHKFSEKYEIHAEQNAIIFAAKEGISINESDIYTTLHPCNDCLKIICNSGIKNIYYLNEYDKLKIDKLIEKMLIDCGVHKYKILI